MEENRNIDFKIEDNSIEDNLNFGPGLSNSSLQPGPSNLNPLQGSSNLNPQPGPSNSNPQSSSSRNHCPDRDRKIPKKRSHSDNDDWSSDKELNNMETPVKVKKEGNPENVGNERPNENSSDIPPLMSLQEIALASQRKAVAASQQAGMAVPIPDQSQPQIMHQQTISFPSYGYNASESYHMESNQGAYSALLFSSMMPIKYEWPASNALPPTTSNVASTSEIGETVSPTNGRMNGYPYMNIGNNERPLNEILPIMASIPNPSPFPSIFPVLNILGPISTAHSVLIPPPPGERRSRRPKPPGCRTVYVGFLPEKITEEIIREVFKICGPISAVRMSKKNFCHIRFVKMESVDQALLLSGFRIRIFENEGAACNSELHVDYAIARDDQHDYECLERARLREERHRMKEAYHALSPPPIPHFSEDEAQTVAEKLRNKKTIMEGVRVLIAWLERGECNKGNSGTFFSFLQSCHSFCKRFLNESHRDVKDQQSLINEYRAIEAIVKEIEKLFMLAETQKVSDHFTKTQRKKREEMKNDIADLRRIISECLTAKRDEEDMELESDLELDNEDRNENGGGELIKLEVQVNSPTEEQDKDNQIEEFKNRCAEYEDKIMKLRQELEEKEMQLKVALDDSRLISPVSMFLNIHPLGASVDYISAFLLINMSISLTASEVESFLRRNNHLYREINTEFELKWRYIWTPELIGASLD